MVGGTVKAGFCDQGGQFCSILRDLNKTYTGMCRTDADCEVSDGVLATKKLCCDLVHPAKSMEAMCDKVDKVKYTSWKTASLHSTSGGRVQDQR